MKTIASGRYIVKQKLGAGSFGEIYMGEDRESGQNVAIKFENVKTRVPQLSYESKLYSIFKNGVNVPKFFWFGTEGSNNEMVIELLGKSLEDLSGQFPHHRLSLKTVLMLADQMLSAVQYIHMMNFIHRDIKPDNFMMGTGKNANKVYTIDFGLSKKYRDPHTHNHIKYVENKDLTGTARYASLAALKGIEQSRRDDLEALGYVWMYLLRGDLPWMGLDAHNRRQKYERICQAKERTTFESLCAGFPEEFVRYFYTVRQMRFIEEPKYGHFRKMFRKLFLRLGYTYDYVYDWSKPNQNNNMKVQKSNAKDYLSDRGKRPHQPKIPTNTKQPRSKRGVDDNQMINTKFSTAPQPSKTSEEMNFNATKSARRNSTHMRKMTDDLLLRNNANKRSDFRRSEAFINNKFHISNVESSESSDEHQIINPHNITNKDFNKTCNDMNKEIIPRIPKSNTINSIDHSFKFRTLTPNKSQNKWRLDANTPKAISPDKFYEIWKSDTAQTKHVELVHLIKNEGNSDDNKESSSNAKKMKIDVLYQKNSISSDDKQLAHNPQETQPDRALEMQTLPQPNEISQSIPHLSDNTQTINSPGKRQRKSKGNRQKQSDSSQEQTEETKKQKKNDSSPEVPNDDDDASANKKTMQNNTKPPIPEVSDLVAFPQSRHRQNSDSNQKDDNNLRKRSKNASEILQHYQQLSRRNMRRSQELTAEVIHKVNKKLNQNIISLSESSDDNINGKGNLNNSQFTTSSDTERPSEQKDRLKAIPRNPNFARTSSQNTGLKHHLKNTEQNTHLPRHHLTEAIKPSRIPISALTDSYSSSDDNQKRRVHSKTKDFSETIGSRSQKRSTADIPSEILTSPRKRPDVGQSQLKTPSKPLPRQNLFANVRRRLSNPQQRHSLKPSANIPNWMNEKFKGRK